MLAGTAGVLAACGAAAGCSDEGESPAERRRRIDAAQRLRRAAAQGSEALLTRYTGTAAAHPTLSGRLAPLREAVARHVEAFGGTVPSARRGDGGPEDPEGPDSHGPDSHGDGHDGRGEGGSKGGPERSEAPGAGPAAGDRMAVPGDEAGALAALADAERRTADARMRALVAAPPELARLLASVAAAGSTHAFLLAKGDAA